MRYYKHERHSYALLVQCGYNEPADTLAVTNYQPRYT